MTEQIAKVLEILFPPELPQLNVFEQVSNQHDPLGHEVTECGIVSGPVEKEHANGIERYFSEAQPEEIQQVAEVPEAPALPVMSVGGRSI